MKNLGVDFVKPYFQCGMFMECALPSLVMVTVAELEPRSHSSDAYLSLAHSPSRNKLQTCKPILRGQMGAYLPPTNCVPLQFLHKTLFSFQI